MNRLSLLLGVATIAVVAAGHAQAGDSLGLFAEGIGKIEDGVASGNRKSANTAPDGSALAPFSVSSDKIDGDFTLKALVTGADPIENPSGIITKFGVLTDGTLTEPDENTYVVFKGNPGGPTPNYDYGRHFLFQGHEIFGQDMAFITRVNMDVKDPAHRITLLTPVGNDGKTHLNDLDGSIYDPFTYTFLFSEETAGRIIQLSAGWPVTKTTLEAHIGLGGFEGLKLDDKGNLYIIEDAGGATSNNTAYPLGNGQTVSLDRAKQPNSFVYRFIPKNKNRLEDGGELQALQVIIDGNPIVFGGTTAAARDADIASDAQLKLHTLGKSYAIKWVKVHQSSAGDTASFDANAAAKAAKATPFKRPENMAWLPGSNFKTFFFSPTGDTNAVAGDNPFLRARGAYGALFRVDLRDDDHRGPFAKPAADDGRISLFFLGDHDHNSFDNIAFANMQQLLAAEDRGDGLHNQLNTLDSIWAFDVSKPCKLGKFRSPDTNPVRFVALGLDGTAVTKGDNEPTGIYVSNGSTSTKTMLGTRENLLAGRAFFTHQHGDNLLYEVSRKPKHLVNN
jgi:hypothetical protein